MGFYSDVILPFLMDRELRDERFATIRREVLRDVRGRVLEVGFGTGANLPCYPEGVGRLVVVEPSGGMSRRAAQWIREWRGVVESHQADGEALPFPDASFDSVAMTLTLCSVRDTAAVLFEIRRVLVAGGTYHFFEHVASSEPRASKWQRRLNGINSALGGGCQLTRDAESLIAASGFTFERIERALLPGGGITPRWLFPGIWGKAVRTG